MATKRQMRSAKKLKNIKKQRGKYPLLLGRIIEVSDIILEILDARFPKEMQNKEIEKLTGIQKTSVNARRNELMHMDLVSAKGIKRVEPDYKGKSRGNTVWIAVFLGNHFDRIDKPIQTGKKNIPDIPISDGSIPLTSSNTIDRKSIE